MKKQEKMVKVEASISANQKRELKSYCKKHKKSMSEAIRDMIKTITKR